MNFVLSLAVFILSVGAAGRQLPYTSLLCGISVVFALSTFVSLSDASDKYALFAVFFNLISWYFLRKFWREIQLILVCQSFAPECTFRWEDGSSGGRGFSSKSVGFFVVC